ncbi:MAG: peptide-methionine (S)-S-oxide reductase [Gemmatimonadetes bacterium]|nr:MAG: peptide-methionine (S)-S-oxide reductase [Gemmatimonadota bacterium]
MVPRRPRVPVRHNGAEHVPPRPLLVFHDDGNVFLHPLRRNRERRSEWVGRSARRGQAGLVEVATLAGGCFWCLEAVFEQLRGVTKVVSGYAGGHVPTPSYEAVCTGTTGHAEVVQVTFDPDQLSYRDLLGVFFTLHDPTTLDRQGGDVGTQYRSAIFYHDDEQRRSAEEVVRELEAEHVFDDAIVTKLEPLKAFYPAEEYHREYYRRNQNQPYCRAVIAPKVAKLRSKYLEKLKA